MRVRISSLVKVLCAAILLSAVVPQTTFASTKYHEWLRNPDLTVSSSKAKPITGWSVWPMDAAQTGQIKITSVAKARRKDGSVLRLRGVANKKKSVSIFQSLPPSITLRKGMTYIGSIRVKGNLQGYISLTSVGSGGHHAHFAKGQASFAVPKGGKPSQWRWAEFRFTPKRDYGNLKFVINVKGKGTLEIDGVSLLAPHGGPAGPVAARPRVKPSQRIMPIKPQAASKPKTVAVAPTPTPAPTPAPTKAAPLERVARPKDLNWSYDAMWKRKTATRDRLCLNGYWRFQPVPLTSRAIPQNDWGFIRTPNCWYSGPHWADERHVRIYGADKANPKTWNGKAFRDWQAGWYQRKVEIPANWKGRDVRVELNNVDFKAEVFWNGVAVGEAEFLAGASLDVTQAVRFGETNTVSIRVQRLGKGSQAAGISGDIYLVAARPGPQATFLRTETDVRNNKATVVANVSGASGTNVIAECVVEQNGKPVATWRTKKPVALTGKEFQVPVSGSTKNLQLWELVDAPALYDVKVRLLNEKGVLLDETFVEGIGFRDFRIRGNQFYLNGKPCRLRPTLVCQSARPYEVAGPPLDDLISNMKESGYNALYIWSDCQPRAINLDLATLFRQADQRGIAVFCSIPGVGKQFTENRAGQKLWRTWRSRVKGTIQRYERYPSLLVYVTNINYPVYAGTGQDPSKMDGVYYPKNDATYTKDRRIVQKSIDYIRCLDPSRPVSNHDGCNTAGDIFSQNNYLAWTPLQEKEEWLSLWSKKGTKPLSIGEYGGPSSIALNLGRPGPTSSLFSERACTEYCAIYLGPEAYRLEEERYVRDTTSKPQYLGPDKYISSFWYYNMAPPPPYVKLTELTAKNTYRAWRTYGISGGMVDWHEHQLIAETIRPRTFPMTLCPTPRAPGLWPEHRRAGLRRFWERWDDEFWTYYKPTGHLDVRKNMLRPLLAYIGGKPGRFTAKDHNFFLGDTVTKQIILINDSRRKRTITLQLRVTLDGKTLPMTQGQPEHPITLDVGEIRKLPLTFTLPAGGLSKAGMIRMTMKEADQKDVVDAFAFQTFPPEHLKLKGKVALFDPAGRSAKALKQIDCAFTKVKAGDDLQGFDLLILGSKALSEKTVDRFPFDLSAFLARGGKVLVLEQTDKALFYRFGLRVATPCARRVFVGDMTHPVLAGLDDADLADWNGSGTLIDPYPTHSSDMSFPKRWWCGFYNDRNWKWGNYGSVATTVIEKPHTPDLVPLAQCEFDLRYTPLLEWRAGKGKAIFFQFDVSGRDARDPVAERLLARTLTYLDSPSAANWRPTYYVGNNTGRELLAALHVDFHEGKDIDSLPADALLVVGGKTTIPTKKQLAAFVKRGGRVFFLAPAVRGDLAWIAPGLKTETKALWRTDDLPDDPFFRGLSLADVHWRSIEKRKCLAGLPKNARADREGLIARIPNGKGSYYFCLIDPNSFDVTKKTFLRMSKTNSYVLWARLLANAGARAINRVWTYRYNGPFVLDGKWRIHKDTGKSLAGANVNDSSWPTIFVPGTWESQLKDYRDHDGSAWYRRKFVMPRQYEGQKLMLRFVADDLDEAYINGKKIGETNKKTNPKNYWSVVRAYDIPEGLLKFGKENTITVKVTDIWMSAGIIDSIRIVPDTLYTAGSVYVTDLRQTDDPFRYGKW